MATIPDAHATMTPVTFTLNGRSVQADVEADRTLLSVLREDFDLISPKNGCEPQASCGCCAVLVDGAVKLACAMKATAAAGREVVTLEGFSERDRDLLAESFVEAGGLQCGFCIPGFAVRAHALLEKNPNPTRDEIVKALRPHLCRCTGYVKIVDAIELMARRKARREGTEARRPGGTQGEGAEARRHEGTQGGGARGGVDAAATQGRAGVSPADQTQQGWGGRLARRQPLSGETPDPPGETPDPPGETPDPPGDAADRPLVMGGGVGTRLARYRGREFVLGDHRYVDDIKVPGCLFAAMRFSDHPRARVRRIDASAALALPGVHRVITADDVPGERYVGLIVQDWPVLVAVGEETRCIGDVLAVVVADDQRLARRAAGLVEVEYDVLEPVTDPERALEPGAPKVHPGGNLLSVSRIQHGDIEAAFADSAHVVEDTFQTQRIEHMFLEPEACIAIPGRHEGTEARRHEGEGREGGSDGGTERRSEEDQSRDRQGVGEGTKARRHAGTEGEGDAAATQGRSGVSPADQTQQGWGGRLARRAPMSGETPDPPGETPDPPFSGSEPRTLNPEPSCPNPEPYLRVLTQGQGVFDDQRQIARILGWPIERVRVELVSNGGAFGGKEDMSIQGQTALAAALVGRPVKCTLTRDESFRLHPKRHAIKMHVKVGCDADGHMTAVRARMIGDKGAYASVGAKVLERAAGHAVGPYKVSAVDIEAKAVYTNNPPCGAMRGFGANQAAFAVENLLNRLARRVGIDAWDIRWRNILHQGDRFCTGQRLDKPFGLRETMLAVKDAFKSARYAGIACGIKNVGIGNGMPDEGKAVLRVEAPDRVTIRTGFTEMGQGYFTICIQTACQETGLPPEVFVPMTDTSVDANCGQTTASRATVLGGLAIIDACRQLREEIERVSHGATEGRGDEGGDVAAGPRAGRRCAGGADLRDDRSARLAALGALVGREFRGQYSCTYTTKLGADVPEPKTHLTYGFATQVVILDDDGAIRKVIAAHDVGRVMNPTLLEGQMQGSIHMGLGYALTEDFPCENGQLVNKTVKSLGVLRAHQMPEVECIFIEQPDPETAYGARGVGEIGLVPTAPAVAGALEAFDGTQRTTLPMKDSPAAKAILRPKRRP